MSRYHWDIYAILEAPQELYFGHEVEINVNRVETVKVEGPEGKLEKVYFSPTKRRGVERRTLLWSPHRSEDTLGDYLKCGIPNTCARTEDEGNNPACPICRIYGALNPGKKTVIGRLTHGGGVAIQALGPEEKQRAMHPSRLVRAENDASIPAEERNPTPFRREYNQPGMYYPVYNHALSVSEEDFTAAAYSFLNALPRIGAGNPKGASLVQDDAFGLYLVLDRYLVPKGKRPIVSAHETNVEDAKTTFRSLAHDVRGVELKEGRAESEHFNRWVGDAALAELERLAETFTRNYLV